MNAANIWIQGASITALWTEDTGVCWSSWSHHCCTARPLEEGGLEGQGLSTWHQSASRRRSMCESGSLPAINHGLTATCALAPGRLVDNEKSGVHHVDRLPLFCGRLCCYKGIRQTHISQIWAEQINNRLECGPSHLSLFILKGEGLWGEAQLRSHIQVLYRSVAVRRS